MKFEHSRQPLLSPKKFALRLLRSGTIACGVVFLSLLFGASGYHLLENIPWLDAFLNAAMILTGMGPVSDLQSAGGKIFAICYCLYSGIVFLAVIGIIFVPVIHRILHAFHVETDDQKKKK